MTKITDEMVERAIVGYRTKQGAQDTVRDSMRCALEAAFNPPAEPEVVVTDEMLQAGRGALNMLTILVGPSAHLPCNSYTNAVRDTFRAMRKLEPVPTKTRAPCTGSWRDQPCALADACCMNRSPPAHNSAPQGYPTTQKLD